MPEADAVRAGRSVLVIRCFAFYLRWYVRRRFHAVRLLRPLPALPVDRPLIVYANHPSWWDLAIIGLVSIGPLGDRVSYGPMDEVGLDQYPFLRKLGIFGIDLATKRAAAQFLRTSLGLLKDRNTVLWILPEGRFVDARVRPITIRPGVAHLARHIKGAVFLPMALEYPFWDQSTPEALIHFGAPILEAGELDVPGWTTLFEARLTQAMDELADAAVARDPARFLPLIGGTAGVGGIYDLWRRLKAISRGRRFDAAHGARK
jgi:1-acyl-sn-glycerol-3-phosphate acyltransferase